MNPQHTIPVIDDNGTILYDSHVIVIYLISKYAPKSSLYPQDLVKQARINAILHFESGVLFARLRFLVDKIREVTDMSEVPQDRIDYVLNAVGLLEALLVEEYLVGNKVTVADISCLTSFSSLDTILKLDRAKFPKVNAWFERMKQIPGYQEFNQSAVDRMSEVVRMIFEGNKRK